MQIKEVTERRQRFSKLIIIFSLSLGWEAVGCLNAGTVGQIL